jgi:hypothetical protein
MAYLVTFYDRTKGCLHYTTKRASVASEMRGNIPKTLQCQVVYTLHSLSANIVPNPLLGVGYGDAKLALYGDQIPGSSNILLLLLA